MLAMLLLLCLLQNYNDTGSRTTADLAGLNNVIIGADGGLMQRLGAAQEGTCKNAGIACECS